MANCNLCPPDNRSVPDDEMDEHLRTVHPEVDRDGTSESDNSTIVHDASLKPPTDEHSEQTEWRG